MPQVRVLELIGDDDGPLLSLQQGPLEGLAAADAGPGRPQGLPRFRLFELCAPNERGSIRGDDVDALKTFATRLLNRGDLREQLRIGLTVHLDVSAAPRPLGGLWEALRANAELNLPTRVLTVDTAGNDEDQIDRLIAHWREALRVDVTPPRVNRARPQQPDQAAAVSAARLAALLGDEERFLSSEAVGELIAATPNPAHPKMITSRARRAGRIFGGWDGNAYRYPAFQFAGDGQPRAHVPDLIAVLPRDEDGEVGNDAVLWLFAPDDALGERTPAEVFIEDPARVIALARARREGDDALD